MPASNGRRQRGRLSTTVLIALLSVYYFRHRQRRASTLIPAAQSSRPRVSPAATQVKPTRTYLPLIVYVFIATVVVVWGAILWQPGTGKPIQARGGLLFFADYTSPPHPWVVNIQSKIRPTGWTGISEIHLELQFDRATSGQRWYIVASGQYRPSAAMPLAAFCNSGALAKRARDTISCVSGGAINGSEQIQYQFNGRLGGVGPSGNDIWSIEDFDGYLDGDATIVAGVLSDPVAPSVVWIPFRTPLPATAGSVQYGSFGSIAAADAGDYGEVSRIRSLPEMYASTGASFAIASSGRPVEEMEAGEVALTSEESLGARQIRWADPSTATPDRLIWRNDGGLGVMQFALQDPFVEEHLRQRAFLAGILMTLGLSALAAAALEFFVVVPVRRARRNRSTSDL